MPPEILVTMPLYPQTLETLRGRFVCHDLWTAQDRSSYLTSLRDRVEGIATFTGFPIGRDLLDALPKVKIVATMSIGVDHIDLDLARARGIAVTNTPDVLTEDVADLALGLVLAVSRRIVAADRFVRAGRWLREGFPQNQRVGGRTLGILGLGRIGKSVARRAEAMGMTIVYHGTRPQSGVAYRYYQSLTAMAADSHFLLVSCPGGNGTRHLVSADVLAALGPKGVVINIARGTVIDEDALVEALVGGRLGGAGLDVFVDEPHVPEALFALDSVVLQPHLGSATHDTRRAMGELMIDNLSAYFSGRPLLTRVA